MIFETHAHFDDRRFKDDRDEIIDSLKDSGIGYVINCGADMKSSERGIELTKKYSFFYCSVGVHPHSAKDLDDTKLKKLEAMAAGGKVVAIGEIGLDFYYNHSEKGDQRFWFAKQLELANK
ncbi:MAG: TatD family hydrolase, partial [Clostridiales bacterium]|nr:TatD family hydrolase [Clostridiales bacterium]